MHRKERAEYQPETDESANVARPMAAAGNVHCSIRDFAKFASYELAAAQGNDALVRPATAKRWQELSRLAGPAGGPGAKSGPGKMKKKSPPPGGKQPGEQSKALGNLRPGDGRAFFGGSAFVSTGCML